jgi:hypothetical protein
MSGERALAEGGGEGAAPYSNSEGAPQYTSREVAPQYSSLEGVPQYLSREGASQYTSREGAQQYPSREGAPQYPSREVAPQYTSRDGASQHPSREGAPQYTGRSMPVPILITQPSQPRRLLSERNIVPAAESDPLDLGTEQNAVQGQRKEERAHLPLDLGKDNGYTSVPPPRCFNVSNLVPYHLRILWRLPGIAKNATGTYKWINPVLRVFWLILFEATFTSFFKDKKSYRSHKTVGIKVFLTIFAGL